MDPQACLESLLNALAAHDLDTAAEHWKALYEWLDRGGFAPRVAVDGRIGTLVALGFTPGRAAVVRWAIGGKHSNVTLENLKSVPNPLS